MGWDRINPLKMPPQSVSLSLVKGYRELRRTLQASYQHADDGSPVLQTCFVDTPNAIAGSTSALALQRSMSRAKEFLLESDVRTMYRAAKVRARQKLRDKYHKYKAYASHAMDTTSANMSRYLSNSQASTSGGGGAASYAAALGTGSVREAASEAASSSGPVQSPTTVVAEAAPEASVQLSSSTSKSVRVGTLELDDIYGANGYLRVRARTARHVKRTGCTAQISTWLGLWAIVRHADLVCPLPGWHLAGCVAARVLLHMHAHSTHRAACLIDLSPHTQLSTATLRSLLFAR